MVQNDCWSIRNKWQTWDFIPCEGGVNNADPVARVFNGRMYVYTSWDDKYACGRRWNKPWWKKQGMKQFCMTGYRAYSTANPTLRSGWWAHGRTCLLLFLEVISQLTYFHVAILREERVPWVFRGWKGYKAAAHMWALDVVRGNDGRYYMFFPAPRAWNAMRIGVAIAKRPGGPFWPRPKPIPGAIGIDPSVIRLPSGQWVIFTSGRGRIFVQWTNAKFTRSSPRRLVKGLKSGYKEGPHAELRNGKLLLFYALSRGTYSVEQAVANNKNRPEWGFWKADAAIAGFEGRTNHAISVYFKKRNWIFYHRHMENHGSRWATRKVIFSPAKFRNGYMRTIRPSWRRRRGFQVKLAY